MDHCKARCQNLQMYGLLQEMLGVIAVLTGGRLADTASHFREAFLRYTSAAGEADRCAMHVKPAHSDSNLSQLV